MIKTLLIKNYNATICKINMQVSSYSVFNHYNRNPQALLVPKRVKNNIELYRENDFKTLKL